MGVNWNEGVMRWIPYVDANGHAYPLNHLHPFQYDLVFGEDVRVRIRVAFAMHCFTRHCADDDDPSRYYKDHREIRTFCPDRYALSPRLPVIARELTTRKCGFAKYVTTDVPVSEGLTALYGVFFNVLRVKDTEGPAVLLTVQSAYELAPSKQLPIRGSIKFKRLIELTLKGVKPRPPRN
jgi:hypothetical protein